MMALSAATGIAVAVSCAFVALAIGVVIRLWVIRPLRGKLRCHICSRRFDRRKGTFVYLWHYGCRRVACDECVKATAALRDVERAVARGRR